MSDPRRLALEARSPTSDLRPPKLAPAYCPVVAPVPFTVTLISALVQQQPEPPPPLPE